MPTINTEVEFEVYCDACSKVLDVYITQKNGIPALHIGPCDNCMDDAKSDGYADGMKDGTEHEHFDLP